ncbi:LysR family transcriptional regulator, partial [Azospirillum brasilense]|nr:LysR family transcriptional regulator [Azospirillum brasilense]
LTVLVRAGGAGWEIPGGGRLYCPRARQSPAAEAFWTLAVGQGPQGGRGRE